MVKRFFLPLLLGLVAMACTENVDKSNRYVFRHKTVVDYLASNEQYSQYLDLLSRVPVSDVSETTLRQLLSARGNYTVFAPTNEAIQAYLDTLCKRGIINEPSWEGFPDERVRDSVERVITFNSIIDGGDYMRYTVDELPTRQGGEIGIANMYDRHLTVYRATRFDDDPNLLLVNDARVDSRNRDIPLLNGVLHAVHDVIAPTNNTLGLLLAGIANERREGFYVMAMLVQACGLVDTLDKVKDYAYESLVERGLTQGEYRLPEHRYYGYTCFAETDSLWQTLLGKPALEITPADVADYLAQLNVYPDALNNTDYTHTDNLLNRFVTYHFLPQRLSVDRLVYHRNEKGYDISTKRLGAAMAEYYTTMGKRRMLKIYESKASEGIFLNRFPEISDGRKENYYESGCAPENVGIRVGEPNLQGENNVRNGILYPIEKLLLYDDHTRSGLQRQRIRWDVASMLPELANNSYRMGLQDQTYLEVYFPGNSLYKYLDDMDLGPDTHLRYRYFGYGNNYLHDEFLGHGVVDVTMRMPPVPKRGTYEVRVAVKVDIGTGTVTPYGIYQFYWGSDPNRLAAMGIPVDFRLPGRKIGWEADTGDEDYDAEVDKRLRNQGFMKGTALYPSSRENDCILRRIIVRQTLDPDKVYYLRYKCVDDMFNRNVYLDYLEYCAKEVYDNPEKPEDIW